MDLKYLWDNEWRDLDQEVIKYIIKETKLKSINQFEDNFVKYYECENTADCFYKGTKFMLIVRDFDKEGVDLDKFKKQGN
jgi:hypothetical protein